MIIFYFSQNPCERVKIQSHGVFSATFSHFWSPLILLLGRRGGFTGGEKLSTNHWVSIKLLPALSYLYLPLDHKHAQLEQMWKNWGDLQRQWEITHVNVVHFHLPSLIFHLYSYSEKWSFGIRIYIVLQITHINDQCASKYSGSNYVLLAALSDTNGDCQNFQTIMLFYFIWSL